METLSDPPMTPLRWDQLETFDRDELWVELVAWVQWFVNRYDLDAVLYPCWADHGEVIEELTALWIAHAATYQPGQPPDGPLRWHDNLDRAINRLRRWSGACNSAQHRREPRAEWVTDSDYWDLTRVGPLHNLEDPDSADERDSGREEQVRGKSR